MGSVGSAPGWPLDLVRSQRRGGGLERGGPAASLNQSERRERVIPASGAGAGGFAFAAGTGSFSATRGTDTQGSAHQEAELGLPKGNTELKARQAS
jgi:hypothetical protein